MPHSSTNTCKSSLCVECYYVLIFLLFLLSMKEFKIFMHLKDLTGILKTLYSPFVIIWNITTHYLQLEISTQKLMYLKQFCPKNGMAYFKELPFFQSVFILWVLYYKELSSKLHHIFWDSICWLDSQISFHQQTVCIYSAMLGDRFICK